MELDDALDIIYNWRSSHYHPLNTFQLRLRKKAQEVDGNSLVAQRIKRLFSIRLKLERYTSMRLVQIQDIGGCRAIVSTIPHVEKLADIMTSKDKKRSGRGLKHKLVKVNDYIKNPKTSGYRGVHLVFSYFSDKAAQYNDLQIEIQLRTFLQHAWATAVETVGTFIGQSLKSSIGEAQWLRFFALASSALAAYEGSAGIPNLSFTPDELRSELRRYISDLDVAGHMRSYNTAMDVLDIKELKGAHYYLLELNPDNKSIKVGTYRQGQLEKASSDYLDVEKRIIGKNSDAVLVSADSIAALKKAYPNYFVDTETFLEMINKIIA